MVWNIVAVSIFGKNSGAERMSLNHAAVVTRKDISRHLYTALEPHICVRDQPKIIPTIPYLGHFREITGMQCVLIAHSVDIPRTNLIRFNIANFPRYIWL